MTEAEILKEVKKALGITGAFLDGTLLIYVKEVIQYLLGAGAPSGIVYSSASVGVISRGVSDLWNYGAAGGKLSEYFMQRAIQLSYQDEAAAVDIPTGFIRVCTVTEKTDNDTSFVRTNGIYRDGTQYFLDYSAWFTAPRDSKAGWNITLAQIDDEKYYPPMDLFYTCLFNTSGIATIKIWTTGLITLLPTIDVAKGDFLMMQYSGEYGGNYDA